MDTEIIYVDEYKPEPPRIVEPEVIKIYLCARCEADVSGLQFCPNCKRQLHGF